MVILESLPDALPKADSSLEKLPALETTLVSRFFNPVADLVPADSIFARLVEVLEEAVSKDLPMSCPILLN
ncbi:MAG: hypothetical protein J0I20_35685 [Chloroflexi bacterium]|nr:hypothetical protein [Chloroflexota bacterium]